MKREELLTRVKQVVHAVEPEADIILYGSRARGDAHPESDWDFLILLPGTVDDARTDRVRHRLYELEWDSGEVLSVIVRSHETWDSPLYQITPFVQHVQAQGVVV
jgi:predicted nucleotidyltransferase